MCSRNAIDARFNIKGSDRNVNSWKKPRRDKQNCVILKFFLFGDTEKTELRTTQSNTKNCSFKVQFIFYTHKHTNRCRTLAIVEFLK